MLSPDDGSEDAEDADQAATGATADGDGEEVNDGVGQDDQGGQGQGKGGSAKVDYGAEGEGEASEESLRETGGFVQMGRQRVEGRVRVFLFSVFDVGLIMTIVLGSCLSFHGFSKHTPGQPSTYFWVFYL